MSTCEICASEVSEELGDKPSDEKYFTATYKSEDGLGIGIVQYHFCSIEHLRMFCEEPTIESE